jgi:hypothetical protein
MQFQLHNAYAKAAAPRFGVPARHEAEAYRAEPPPRWMRAHVARVLVGAAARVDRESARRAMV